MYRLFEKKYEKNFEVLEVKRIRRKRLKNEEEKRM